MQRSTVEYLVKDWVHTHSDGICKYLLPISYRADGTCGGWVVTALCRHDISKTDTARITRPAVQMFHGEFLKPIDFEMTGEGHESKHVYVGLQAARSIAARVSHAGFLPRDAVLALYLLSYDSPGTLSFLMRKISAKFGECQIEVE